MVDQFKSGKLWTPRSTKDTMKIYADWADTYEADITSMNYATPDRIAQALKTVLTDATTPILDYGCGTGLSGMALRRAGFTVIDGTDISQEMLEQAAAKTVGDASLYRRTWLSDGDQTDLETGRYPVIVATGVISLGAATPQLLTSLLNRLDKSGLLAFSYNDPTLADENYITTLDRHIAAGDVDVLFREYGPHLSETITGADVIILKRT